MFATGASQPFPMRPKQEWSAEEIERHFKVMQQEIAASKNIVVMGGGPTGIEFVGVSARMVGAPALPAKSNLTSYLGNLGQIHRR